MSIAANAPQRPSRHPLRLVGRVLVLLLGAWLVVDKAMGVVSPDPSVGHWRSAEGQRAYARAYDSVMAGLPGTTHTRDVRTTYGTVRVLTWEGTEAGPPVMLLPGHSSGAPMWAENLPAWIGARTVHALDPLGDAGFSVQALPLTTFDEQAEWISQTLTGLGVDRAHVVGHSFGAANAAVFAVRHPEQITTLTLLEPVFVVRPVSVSTFVWATLTQLPVPQSWKDRALAEIGGTTVEAVQERTPMSVMIDAASGGYSTALPVPRRLTDDEWRVLQAHNVPVRVDIAGMKSLAGGEEAATRIRTLLPEATVTLWPRATHSLPMQEKAALGPQLLNFWRSHS